jgi:anti-sigma regulatory factor (Ser/Thr protein kinase)
MEVSIMHSDTLCVPPRRRPVPTNVLEADLKAVRGHQSPAPRPLVWADAGDQVRRTTLPRVPAAASAARHFMDAAAADWRLPEHVAEVLRLLLSELVTNSVLHAAAPAGAADAVRVDVHLVSGAVVVLAVADEDPTEPAEKARPTEAQILNPLGAAGVGGAGLTIVKALSCAFGSAKTESGKTVWCVVPVVAVAR